MGHQHMAGLRVRATGLIINMVPLKIATEEVEADMEGQEGEEGATEAMEEEVVVPEIDTVVVVVVVVEEEEEEEEATDQTGTAEEEATRAKATPAEPLDMVQAATVA
jgi:hypothetical protein